MSLIHPSVFNQDNSFFSKQHIGLVTSNNPIVDFELKDTEGNSIPNVGQILCEIPGIYKVDINLTNTQLSPELIENKKKLASRNFPLIYPKNISSAKLQLNKPEVGNQVIIEFLHSDPHLPVYTSVYRTFQNTDPQGNIGGKCTGLIGRSEQILIDENLGECRLRTSRSELTLASQDNNFGIELKSQNPVKLKSASTELSVESGKVSILGNTVIEHGRQITSNDKTVEERVNLQSFYNKKDENTSASFEETVYKEETIVGAHNYASGHRSSAIAGNDQKIVSGNKSELIAGTSSLIIGRGESRQIPVGNSEEVVLLGNITKQAGLTRFELNANGSFTMSGTLASVSAGPTGLLNLSGQKIFLGNGAIPVLLSTALLTTLVSHKHLTPSGLSEGSNDFINASDFLSKSVFIS